MNLKFTLWAIISGVLASLPWYGASIVPLFIAFIPLLYVEFALTSKKNQNTPLVFWVYAFVFTLVWHFAVAWWGTKVSPSGAVFALVLYAFLMSLVLLLFHLAHRSKNSGFAIVFLVFSFISYEYLQLNWDISWPWLTLGGALANDVILIQWYEYTGVLGGSLWILLINIFVWDLLKQHLIFANSIRFVRYMPLIIFFTVPTLFSVWKYYNYTEDADPLTIALLQPNIDPYAEKFSGMDQHEQYSRLISLAEKQSGEVVDVYAGPETALHNVWNDKLNEHPGVKMVNSFLASKPGAAFIAGANYFWKYTSGEKVGFTARQSDDLLYMYDSYNSVLFFSETDSIAKYHKSKLVAGVEKMPFARYFSALSKYTVDLGGVSGSLATGNNPVVFHHGRAKIATPICYESVYGEYLIEFIRKGANLLIIVTNDGWWDKTPGYRQHLMHSKLRAIELRRGVARAANTGISCFIDQRGKITSSTQWWNNEVLTANINMNSTLTFYARHGDYIARISLFMFILMFLSILVVKIKKLR
jgi:apolipoprotein N-acyltransferase